MVSEASGISYRNAPQPPPISAWTNVGDFWNDPRRWDGVDDSHKTCFWMVRRPDVIDVRQSEVTSAPGRMGTPYISSSCIMGNAAGHIDTSFEVVDIINPDDLRSARRELFSRYATAQQQPGLAAFLNVGGPIW